MPLTSLSVLYGAASGICKRRHHQRFAGGLTCIEQMLFFIRESRTVIIYMNLKPQDILFLLKLIAIGGKPWTFNSLAADLSMSASEVHAAAKRVLEARLAVKKENSIMPDTRNLEEFLLHGIQYVFVPERGGLIRGVPTAHAVEPLAFEFIQDNEPPPVWPDPEGVVRGESFSPLYKSATKAARNDRGLYRLLALVDAIRGGRAREQELAKKIVQKILATQRLENNSLKRNDPDKLVIGDEIEVSCSDLMDLVKRFHINRINVFGSAARGELGPDSDIDLLIEFEKSHSPSIGGMVEIQDAFEKLFHGRRVDVATPSILNNPYRKRAIEKDMEELYAA